MLLDIPLHRGLRLGLSALRWVEPTEVQVETIPVAMEGRDLLISAETGSGKTLAYLIPSAQQILTRRQVPGDGPLVLILVPTRELARQVARHFVALATKTPLGCEVITGGNSYKYQKALLRKNSEFLVSTPGRLLELLTDGSADLGNVQVLILDEADRLLDMGFKKDVLSIIEYCSPERQTLLVSATLKHKGVRKFAHEILNEPGEIIVGYERTQHPDISQQVILADDKGHKEKLVTNLLKLPDIKKALVFANTRSQANQLGGYLSYQQFKTGILHGDMTQEERNHVTSAFSHGKIQVLVASDVAARGLDVRAIDAVINFDLPRNAQDYIHRIGRTGRAGRKGLAISFVTATDWNLMVGFERYLGERFERRVLKGLKAKFKGPKKIKSSGKAVGAKKGKVKSASKGATRQRNTKNKGKPKESAAGLNNRRDSKNASTKNSDGFSPLMRKKEIKNV